MPSREAFSRLLPPTAQFWHRAGVGRASLTVSKEESDGEVAEVLRSSGFYDGDRYLAEQP